VVIFEWSTTSGASSGRLPPITEPVMCRASCKRSVDNPQTLGVRSHAFFGKARRTSPCRRSSAGHAAARVTAGDDRYRRRGRTRRATAVVATPGGCSTIRYCPRLYARRAPGSRASPRRPAGPAGGRFGASARHWAKASACSVVIHRSPTRQVVLTPSTPARFGQGSRRWPQSAARFWGQPARPR
jgi:hypothetical protein